MNQYIITGERIAELEKYFMEHKDDLFRIAQVEREKVPNIFICPCTPNENGFCTIPLNCIAKRMYDEEDGDVVCKAMQSLRQAREPQYQCGDDCKGECSGEVDGVVHCPYNPQAEREIPLISFDAIMGIHHELTNINNIVSHIGDLLTPLNQCLDAHNQRIQQAEREKVLGEISVRAKRLRAGNFKSEVGENNILDWIIKVCEELRQSKDGE